VKTGIPKPVSPVSQDDSTQVVSKESSAVPSSVEKPRTPPDTGGDIHHEGHEGAGNVTVSADRAVHLAQEATGLETVGVVGNPQLTKAAVVEIPFLGKTVTGRPVWVVDVTNVVLRLKSATSDSGDPYSRKARILIDSETGQVLEICISVAGEQEVFPQPSMASAEEQMRNSGETYTGFPSDPPRTSLIDTLDAVLSNGIGSPFLAKEISAVYVNRSQVDGQITTIWAVTLNGIPPLKPHGRGAETIPLAQLTHIRNIVDARTGKVLNATTVPQVDVGN
jgi:hypothetical protein